jgi:ABC-2 type transport system permease protein
LKNVWTLTRIRMLLALRNRMFIFFSIVMPLSFLFIYAFIFAGGRTEAIRYLFPSILALTVMGSFWGLSVQLVLYREQGILRRFRLSPIGPAAMLGSGILSNYLLTFPTLFIEFALMRWYFHVTDFGNLFGALVLVTLGMVAFSSLGLIIASVANSMQETQVLNNLIWFPLLFLSGVTVPFPQLPHFVQSIGYFLPATHLVYGLQAVMLGGASLLRVYMEILSLVGGALFCFFISAKLFRWEPEEKVDRRSKLLALAAVIPFLLLGAWENLHRDRMTDARRLMDATRSQSGPRPAQQQTPSPPNSVPDQPRP